MAGDAEPGPTPEAGPFRYSNVALEVSSGKLVTLQGADDQTVEEMKVRCRSLDVRCPVEDCEAPELSATLGYARKDGTSVTAYFSHKAGAGDGGHGPEGYARVRIKRAIAEWALGLGLDAEVDLLIPEAAQRTDIAIDGPANFAVDVQRPSLDGVVWAERNEAFHAAGLQPRSLWLAPGGSCVGSFDLRYVAGEYEDLHDVWLAGIDEEGRVRLAMASGFPTFAYEAAQLVDNAPPPQRTTGFPARCQPLWRELGDITLDETGFVDEALRQLIEDKSRPDHWTKPAPAKPTGPSAQPLAKPLDGQLFATHDGATDIAGVGHPPALSGWSPEELSTPGTRWMRDLLHDRRHHAFLDGVDPKLID